MIHLEFFHTCHLDILVPVTMALAAKTVIVFTAFLQSAICDGDIIQVPVLAENTAELECPFPSESNCKHVKWSRAFKDISWQKEGISVCTSMHGNFSRKFHAKKIARNVFLMINDVRHEDTMYRYTCSDSLSGTTIRNVELQIYAPKCSGSTIIITDSMDVILSNQTRVLLNCSIGIPTFLTWSFSNGTTVEASPSPSTSLEIELIMLHSDARNQTFRCDAVTHISKRPAACSVEPTIVIHQDNGSYGMEFNETWTELQVKIILFTGIPLTRVFFKLTSCQRHLKLCKIKINCLSFSLVQWIFCFVNYLKLVNTFFEK